MVQPGSVRYVKKEVQGFDDLPLNKATSGYKLTFFRHHYFLDHLNPREVSALGDHRERVPSSSRDAAINRGAELVSLLTVALKVAVIPW
jgi:hypothetical protein